MIFSYLFQYMNEHLVSADFVAGNKVARGTSRFSRYLELSRYPTETPSLRCTTMGDNANLLRYLTLLSDGDCNSLRRHLPVTSCPDVTHSVRMLPYAIIAAGGISSQGDAWRTRQNGNIRGIQERRRDFYLLIWNTTIRRVLVLLPCNYLAEKILLAKREKRRERESRFFYFYICIICVLYTYVFISLQVVTINRQHNLTLRYSLENSVNVVHFFARVFLSKNIDRSNDTVEFIFSEHFSYII